MDFIVAYYLILYIEKLNEKLNEKEQKNKEKNIIVKKSITCNLCGQNMYWCLCKY